MHRGLLPWLHEETSQCSIGKKRDSIVKYLILVFKFSKNSDHGSEVLNMSRCYKTSSSSLTIINIVLFLGQYLKFYTVRLRCGLNTLRPTDLKTRNCHLLEVPPNNISQINMKLNNVFFWISCDQ